MSRSRSFCFTVNNPMDDNQNPYNLLEVSDYLVFQLELGENGTPHYQGFVHLKDAKTITAMQTYLRAHFIVAKGTAAQNRIYCTKEEGRLDGPYEEGEIPKQGKRSDCADVVRLIKEGASNATIFESHPNAIRYYKGLDFVRQSFKADIKRTWKTRVIVYYGVAGSGKSYTVQQLAGPDAYFKPGGNKWFNAYEGQEIVVFDEFRGNWFDLSTFLRIMDAYPCAVETKGGIVEFVARTLYITSNVAPESWYPNIDAIQLAAVMRRLDEIHHFINPFIPPPPSSPGLLPSPPPQAPE